MKVETIDNSIFISSKTDKTMFFLNFIDDETANKATTIMQEIIAEKKISSLEESIVFLDLEKLSYQTGDKFLMSAAFVEEYLVPKYGIKPGSKIKNQDNTFVSLSHNWNSKKQNYDYITEIYKDCTKILSDWNSKEKKYNDLLIFYSDHLDKDK